MNPLVAGLSVFSLVAGVFLAVDGARAKDRALSTGPSTSLWTTVDKYWGRQSRAVRIRLLGSLAAGVVAFALSGWPIALVAVPLVVTGLPALLAEPHNRDIEILGALDRWVRQLAASLPTGKSIPDAMRVTARQAPGPLQPAVGVMVARLDARWTTREALMALADDLDCPDADAVIAALVLAAQRGGAGATSTLKQLADSIQGRLRALREIEAERAKPRVVVRQVTIISICVICAALVLQPDFFAPYGSPAGQLAMACWVVCYLVALLAMRRMTIPRKRERILQAAPQPVAPGTTTRAGQGRRSGVRRG